MDPSSDKLATHLQGLGLHPDDGQLTGLRLYLLELELWNRRFGFIKADADELVTLHLLDSLAGVNLLRAHVPAGGAILDFGSGAGFPGLPLAVFMPDRRFTLCERKATERAFLANMIALLKLGQVTVTDRLDSLPKSSFQAAVCRAVAPIAEIDSAVRAFLAPDGFIFAYKGKRENIDAEIAAAGNLRCEVHRLMVPGVERERHILVARR